MIYMVAQRQGLHHKVRLVVGRAELGELRVSTVVACRSQLRKLH